MASSNHKDDAVDKILQELQGQQGKSSGSELDDIMAELGYGAPSRRSPARPHTQPAAEAQQQQQPSSPRIVPTAPRTEAAAPPQPVPTSQRFVPTAPQPQPEPSAEAWLQAEAEPQRPMRTGKASAIDRVDPDKFTSDTELLSWFAEDESTPKNKKESKKAEKARKRRDNEQRREQRRAQKDTQQGFAAPDEWDETQDYTLTGTENAWDEAADFGLEADDAQESLLAEGYAEEWTARQRNGAGQNVYAPANQTQDAPDFVHQGDFAPADEQGFFTQQPEQQDTTAPDWRSVPQDDVVTGSAFDEEDWDGGWADEEQATRSFEIVAQEAPRMPVAAFTQEFGEPGKAPGSSSARSLYVEDMVDDRFREFFSETVSVGPDDVPETPRPAKKRGRKRRHQLLTGEFAKLADDVDGGQQAAAPEDEYAEYNSPQDAPDIEQSIRALEVSLLWRAIGSGVLALLLFWMGLGAAGILPLPGFVQIAEKSLVFPLVYLVLVAAAVGINFATVAPGLVGLGGEATVDTPVALAAVAALLQAVVVLVQLITLPSLGVTLFGGVAALLLGFNALGKYVRARAIFDSFQLASAGADHSAAYVLDSTQELAYAITRGLEEGEPAMLVSRPTALVKGFMRQSFSPRWSDGVGRRIGWVLLGAALLAAGVAFWQTKMLLVAISAFAAIMCIGAPLTSSMVSGLPSMLMQRGASKVGAVVPGWSAIEELGEVNVVMAQGRDIFPPSSIRLHGLRATEMQNINMAILYAASVIVEGCDTLRDIFLALINNRTDTLLRVESLVTEAGRGFTAWVDGKRIVLGTREMMQKHDIQPPPVETELKYAPGPDRKALYLAVSGRLYGMFVLGYSGDGEVANTLDGLVNSGVSLLVHSTDMNVSAELIEHLYQLPQGIIKVLGPQELELLEPLTGYMDESEGAMTHIGTFTSYIGGLRAAASCAAAERMGGMLQIISTVFASALGLLLVFFGGLADVSVWLLLLCQLAWGLVGMAIPFGRRY